nr:uncharacterized protein I203_02242 [Kwoniella mangroviensis CBS 8507]OCF68851.1 hypothetical protein I203_02242 [Kwoniella mangroviensis CBS 8507]
MALAPKNFDVRLLTTPNNYGTELAAGGGAYNVAFQVETRMGTSKASSPSNSHLHRLELVHVRTTRFSETFDAFPSSLHPLKGDTKMRTPPNDFKISFRAFKYAMMQYLPSKREPMDKA